MIYIDKYMIRTSPTFEEELTKIYKYILYQQRKPISAKTFYRKVIKEIYYLKYFPERYVKISSYKNQNKNLRRLPINKYVVIYEVKNDTRTSIYFTYFSE